MDWIMKQGSNKKRRATSFSVMGHNSQRIVRKWKRDSLYLQFTFYQLRIRIFNSQWRLLTRWWWWGWWRWLWLWLWLWLSEAKPAYKPVGPGVLIFGIITLPLVINYAFGGWAKRVRKVQAYSLWKSWVRPWLWLSRWRRLLEETTFLAFCL